MGTTQSPSVLKPSTDYIADKSIMFLNVNEEWCFIHQNLSKIWRQKWSSLRQKELVDGVSSCIFILVFLDQPVECNSFILDLEFGTSDSISTILTFINLLSWLAIFSWLRCILYLLQAVAPLFSVVVPKFQFKGANKRGIPVSRDLAAMQAKYSDPLVYTGPIRVRTGHEILRISSHLMQNLRSVTSRFLCFMGPVTG